MNRTIVPCGDLAFLVELDSLEDVLALHQELVTSKPTGMLECLAAARTVLVRAISPVAAIELARHVRELQVTGPVTRDSEEITLDVCYDGEDLDDVARLVGMSREAVIQAHTSQAWTAAFGGFAPGFVYCVGENDSLDVERRSSPRTAVPAGAVAIAGNFSAVYPRATPGGWQLLGRTAEPMWDTARERPSLIAPGDIVRYRAVPELIQLAERPTGEAPPVDYGFRVVATGLQSLFQDQGRVGFADLGVSASGAMDLRSARRANLLVGNPTGGTVIENLMGGLTIEAIGDLVAGVAGADVPLRITGEPLGGDVSEYTPEINRPFALLSGQRLAIGAPRRGLRSYLAVRGGIEADEVLGSTSSDLLSGEGPAPLAAGDVVRVGAPQWPSFVSDPKHAPTLPRDLVSVSVILGPRDEWFDPDQIDLLLSQEWTVTDISNRIGLRLDGEPLTTRDLGELPSEGTVAGAIQIPREGKPVVFMRDHPVTGGYPVIGVVPHHDLDVLAQLPPGSKIRFRLYHLPSVADDAIGDHS
ncbi:urea amidolyase [Bowdeniella nasicola]|uniref:Urea amidolyase n=1 Tax=Bowdeniella nasicola TaxID=208480 RepID=A0A1Q5Q4Z6_9ACTO|nr:5-oxoprolinase/urea amidolyase family protein [Bowdeniella nasicola]OKL54700.1 urea amidolyase [Bowdeniella nasicola]